jgi:ubiquinone/menaquinone biosynthesis C-methylase UbiE
MSKTQFPHYPQITSRSFVQWNEEMFKKYNNERVYEHSNVIIRFIERRRVRKILDFLSPIKKTDYILAAGCGEGYIEKKIPDAKILLADISKEAIKRAREKLKEDSRYTFLQANLDHLPMKSQLFNKIECSEVLEHVLSPQKILNEFARVLKDNGILVVSFPNEPLINTIKRILIKFKLFYIFFPNIPADMTEEWHLRSYTLNAFKIDIRNIWTIEKLSGIPFNFLPIRYVVLCKKK